MLFISLSASVCLFYGKTGQQNILLLNVNTHHMVAGPEALLSGRNIELELAIDPAAP